MGTGPQGQSPVGGHSSLLPWRLPLLVVDVAAAARLADCRLSPPLRPISAMWLRSRLTASPPFWPARRASSESNSWAVPFWWAAWPPLLAISRCWFWSMAAKPRLAGVPVLLLPLPLFWALPPVDAPLRAPLSLLVAMSISSYAHSGRTGSRLPDRTRMNALVNLEGGGALKFRGRGRDGAI